MADPIIISASLIDAASKRKSYVWYAPSGGTLSDIQTAFTASAPKLDAVTDAKIASAGVFFPLTLPGGLKSAAIDDNRVREGALLSFSADSTFHRYSSYVPAWANAGYTADSDIVLNTGVYAAFINDLVANYSQEDALALVAYLEGVRTFRK